MTLRWFPDGPVRGTAVLLHGFLSYAGSWWRIGPGLAERGWRTYAFDLAGHGDSPRLDRPLDAPTLLDGVLDEIARTPGLEPPIDLIAGHDLGAMVALALVDRRPDLARALVVEEPYATTTCSRRTRRRQLLADAEIARTDRDRLIRRERITNPGWSQRDVEHCVEGIARADSAAIASSMSGRAMPWHLTDLIATVPVPTLVIAAPDHPGRPGDETPSALRGLDRDAVQRLVPPGHFAVLSGGHFLHRDQPERWLARTSAFTEVVFPEPGREVSPDALEWRTHSATGGSHRRRR